MKIDIALQKFGLNEKQIKVYLACLELGSGSVQKISRKAGLIRSTVYEVLEVLRERGFVSFFLKKRVKYYSAEDPSQLIRSAEIKINALHDVLPELNALVGSARHHPRVRFYQGKEEMKIILEEILAEADEIISFGSAVDLFKELGDYFQTFVERRIKNKIPVRTILLESELARERQRLGQIQLRQVVIMPDKYTHHGIVFIWRDKIAMFSFVKDFVAIVVESRELADVHRAMLNCLWDLLARK